MSIDDTTMCKVAKKLHNIAPATMIDDPLVLNRLLVSWYEKFMKDEITDWPELDSDEDAEFNKWFKAQLEENREG
jgi:hypothetical protein